jgi:hypothetical protein
VACGGASAVSPAVQVESIDWASSIELIASSVFPASMLALASSRRGVTASVQVCARAGVIATANTMSKAPTLRRALADLIISTAFHKINHSCIVQINRNLIYKYEKILFVLRTGTHIHIEAKVPQLLDS